MANDLNIQTIPLFMLILTLVTFCVTYLWSVGNGHVSAVFPSISDTGAFPPESCLFGEMANIAAVLMALTVFIRFLILRDFAYVDNLQSFSSLLHANIILGLLAALGITLVANYQSITITPLHYVGAYILFGLGAVYMIIDVVLSYNTAIFPNQSRFICHLRAFLAAIAIIFILLMIICGVGASKQRTGGLDDPSLLLIWRPEDGGYELHVVSNVSEWIIGIAELVYFATFALEFSKFRMITPTLRPVNASATLRKGGPTATGSPAGGSEHEINREREPLLPSKSKQFVYIGTGE